MIRAQRHHELKRDVDDRHVRPVVARELVESLHLRVRVVEGEEREAAGDLDRVARLSPSTSGQPPITSGARAPVSKCASIAASLAGWYSRDRAGAEVAGERLEDRRGRADQQRDRRARAGGTRSARSNSSRKAWMPATANPVAA